MRASSVLLCLLFPFSVFCQEKLDAKKLIQNAITAHGGEKVLKKFRGAEQSVKGTMTVQKQKVSFTGSWAILQPDKLKNELSITNQGKTTTVVNVVNGKKGWVSIDGQTSDMPKTILESTREEIHASHLSQLTPLLTKEHKLEMLKETRIGEQNVLAIRVSHKEFNDVDLYFDKVAYYLVRMTYKVKDLSRGGKEVPQSLTFLDYRKDKSGLMYPGRIELRRDGALLLEGKVTKFRPVKTLDEKLFQKP